MTKKTVAADVAGATAPPPPPPPVRLGAAFEMRANGLFRRSGKDGVEALWICGPFQALMQTRDAEAGAWGLMLQWRDQDGNEHRDAIPRALFANDSAELRARLADGGLALNPRSDARQALTEYLASIAPPHRAVCVPRGGWHVIRGRRIFLLPPDQTFGEAPEKVVLQSAAREPGLFACAGTLDGWRGGIASRCVGNSRMVLAIAAAFAAPLLDLLGEDGGGIHLYGASRSGKTTLLRVAASVCGGTPEAGSAGYVRTWRSTGNAIEGTAAAHSDMLLALDEIGQAEGRDIGETAYLLANGLGKARLDRNAGLRAPMRFRTLFLSSGELTLAAKITEAGKVMRAGMEIRMIDLPAEPSGRGVFEDWTVDGSPEALARALSQAVRSQYGTPLRAFLTHVLSLLEADTEFAEGLKRDVEDRVAKWMEPYPNAEGQVRSVARRFSMLALAGTIATEAEITGWPEGEAERALHACLLAWLAARGSTGSREELQALEALRGFVSRHGASRFETWREPVLGVAEADASAPPAAAYRVVARAGWQRWVTEGSAAPAWVYFLTPQAMNEALAGLDFRAAVAANVKAGLIVRSPDGRSSTSMRVPGYGRAMRLYKVPASIIGGGCGGSADGEGESNGGAPAGG